MNVKTNDKINRIRWDYPEKIKVPLRYSKYIWDYSDRYAPLEIYLARLFTYGNYNDIKKVFADYKNPSFTIVNKYPDIRRGVKFWIKYWHENKY